ncbi:MAG: FAD/NAD(P)-binding protein [Phycisphaerales bacterium]|nr:FAD/NAD(P)-binding protein [Phycisphaerales bacterium]
MKTIAIIGGGFAGTMVAANLARGAGAQPLTVVLIERNPSIGRGVAYSTRHRPHLLNVPAGRMSAWRDQPDHFLHWLQERDAGITSGSFVRRSLYGEYVEFTLNETLTAAPPSFIFTRRTAAAAQMRIDANGRARIALNQGDPVYADHVVLAVGNQAPRAVLSPAELTQLGDRYIGDPWSDGGLERCRPDEPLLVIGTGLTMVDFAITLRARGHHAPLIALSRRGLLPHAHRNPPRAPAPFADPFRADEWDGRVLPLLRWIRNTSNQTGEWREVVNSLRGDTATIWSRLSHCERERFLRHLRSFWDIHRHRMPQEIERVVRSMIDGGALSIVAGRLCGVRAESERLFADVRPRGSNDIRTYCIARIVNCTGPECDFSRVADPLLQNLQSTGQIVVDRWGLGLLTNGQGALIDRNGRASEVLYTLGGVRRGDLWETTAVPEIRVQAAELAITLGAAPR